MTDTPPAAGQPHSQVPEPRARKLHSWVLVSAPKKRRWLTNRIQVRDRFVTEHPALGSSFDDAANQIEGLSETEFESEADWRRPDLLGGNPRYRLYSYQYLCTIVFLVKEIGQRRYEILTYHVVPNEPDDDDGLKSVGTSIESAELADSRDFNNFRRESVQRTLLVLGQALYGHKSSIRRVSRAFNHISLVIIVASVSLYALENVLERAMEGQEALASSLIYWFRQNGILVGLTSSILLALWHGREVRNTLMTKVAIASVAIRRWNARRKSAGAVFHQILDDGRVGKRRDVAER